MAFLEMSTFEKSCPRLTLILAACIMQPPQVGRAVAALHCQGRGKSALLRARRRITSGVGKPAGLGPQKQTARPFVEGRSGG